MATISERNTSELFRESCVTCGVGDQGLALMGFVALFLDFDCVCIASPLAHLLLTVGADFDTRLQQHVFPDKERLTVEFPRGNT